MALGPMLARRRERAVKQEAVNGTAETLLHDGTESKFRIYDAKFVTEIGIFERITQRFTLSRLTHLVTMKPARIQFKIELRRSAGAGVEDEWGKLLTACGMFLTTVAVTNNKYTPFKSLTDQNAKALTMWLYIDSVRLGIAGAMGNVKFMGKVGEPMFMEFDFVGRFLGIVEDALNVVTHEAGAVEAFQGVALVYGTGAGASVIASSVELNMNNDVQLRDSVSQAEGIHSAIITARRPELVIDPELQWDTAGSEQDFYSQLSNGTAIAVTFRKGALATTTVDFNCPNAQVTSISDDERKGMQVAGITMALNASTDALGDDEVTVTKT